MPDRRSPQVARRFVGGDGDVVNFSGQIMAMLATRSTAVNPLREAFVRLLVQAAVAESDAAMATLLKDLRRQRVSVVALADQYIPAAARCMGLAWLEDRMSWADVSLGSARLQVVLRDIGSGWSADLAELPHGGSVLLVVPAHEQHTLGAMVLVGQLRRLGVSVCLRMAPDRSELRQVLQAGRFDGVMISAACHETLETAEALVATIRHLGHGNAPVILGGAIVGRPGVEVTCMGADAVTSDLFAALQVCGLLSDARSARKRA
jgi:MerR family transcriptional regulator, light-induced transcriptional regulator